MAKVANKSTASTQKYLDIAEIKEDVVILKDGTIRSVLLASSINFALKAEEEQDAIISGYIDFINSFDYPFQIVVQSRKLSMEKYLNGLKELEKKQQNELLKEQMISYRAFIQELVELGDIMTKVFYVVIPYSPYEVANKGKTFFTKLKEVFTPGDVIKISKENFEKYKRELSIRVNQVIGSLNSLGITAVELDTQSLIETYYNAYNPDSSQVAKLDDINNLQVETNF